METTHLLSENDIEAQNESNIDIEEMPTAPENLPSKLSKMADLKHSISANLFTHHERGYKKILRLFMFVTFMALAVLTTIGSQLLPSFVKFGRSDKEKKDMDISAWVLTGVSVLALIIYWPFSKSPESKKLSSLKNNEKEEIQDLASTLESVKADCDSRFAQGETNELYSSSAAILGGLIKELKGKESSIKGVYEQLHIIDPTITTINALHRLQGREHLLTIASDSEEAPPRRLSASSF